MNDLEFEISPVEIPKIIGIEFYEAEFTGQCAGFQLIYHDFD